MLDPIGTIVIVKLFANTLAHERTLNELITRTLGKIGVIDRHYRKGTIPVAGEFWKCEITKDADPGRSSGCFILEPLESIAPESLFKLLPGMYSERVESGTLIVTPYDPDNNTILPLELKRGHKRFNATIVPLAKHADRKEMGGRYRGISI